MRWFWLNLDFGFELVTALCAWKSHAHREKRRDLKIQPPTPDGLVWEVHVANYVFFKFGGGFDSLDTSIHPHFYQQIRCD